MKRIALQLAAFALATTLSPGASAETPVERYVEVRTVLGFQVTPVAAQSLLPVGWQPAPLAGPNKDVNLLVILTERLLRETADGKPIDGGRSRSVIFVVPAAETSGSGKGSVIVLVLAPPPESVPGVYGVSVQSQIEMTRTRKFGAAGEAGAETWDVTVDDGSKLSADLTYVRATPIRQVATSNVYAAKISGFYRIYRTNQGLDLMRGSALVADRVQSLSFQATGPRFAKLFDGSEKLISVTAVPWHVRDVSLP